jgi:hypothetical protein
MSELPVRRSSIVVVRSNTAHDATVRLQSDPIIRGIQKAERLDARILAPGELSTVVPGTCLLFHYYDREAIDRILSIKNAGQVTIGCIGSDIYNFREYLAVHQITDFFLVPSFLHKSVLSAQVYKPVYVLPEGLDDAPKPALYDFPIKHDRRVMWFGYAESFYKGMSSLVPVINAALQKALISSFVVVTDQSRFGNYFGLPTAQYGHTTIQRTCTEFDYCILSHFPLDLVMNSYIKSDNKLVSAIMMGLIPLVSATPNYLHTMAKFGLEQFVFESTSDLLKLLERLDPASDSKIIRESQIVQALYKRHSDEQIANEFLHILSHFDCLPKSDRLSQNPGIIPAEMLNGLPGVMDHIRDLGPSLLRALKNRLVERV